ncbi:MAG: hypothetical protein ACRCYQ_16590 [Nocardioides sp.]
MRTTAEKAEAVAAVINAAVNGRAELTSTKQACEVLGRTRASHYRAKKPPVYGPALKRPSPPNTLTEAERPQVLKAIWSASRPVTDAETP